MAMLGPDNYTQQLYDQADLPVPTHDQGANQAHQNLLSLSNEFGHGSDASEAWRAFAGRVWNPEEMAATRKIRNERRLEETGAKPQSPDCL